MLRNIFNSKLYVITCLLGTLPCSVNATLIGDNVEAVLGGASPFNISNNFGSGAIGNGIDFQATATDPAGQIWDFSIDIFDNGFTIGFTEQTRPQFANISGPSDMIRISLNDLDWLGSPQEIVNVTLDSYECLGTGNCTFKVNPSVTAIEWTTDSMYVDFHILLSEELYTFSIETVATVPIPPTAWLFLSGLTLLFCKRKSNQK